MNRVSGRRAAPRSNHMRLSCIQPSDDENSDNSNECVVCLSDLRDTLILPCRHLCLCNSCADTLRYQANNCPICRLRKSFFLVQK